MYAKFTILIHPNNNLEDLRRYLASNKYSYESIGRNFYIPEDDMDDVKELLDGWGYGYLLNDE